MVYLVKFYNGMKEKWEYCSDISECGRYVIGTDYLSEAYMFNHEDEAQKTAEKFAGKLISFDC